jgi:hypothetical protein
MTVGNCLDYVQEYIDAQNPKKEKRSRKAKQADFDSF